MPELVFLRRGEEVLRLTMGDDRVILGRGDRCDVVIPDPEVSRQQVALHLDESQGCVLQDLSGKGTVVVGQRLTDGTVPDGGDIVLGQWRAIYRKASGGLSTDTTELGARTELLAQADGTDAPQVPAQVRIKVGAQESSHRLQTESFTAGKDAANDLVLSQRFVSGRHLKVTRRHNRFLVTDQHSTNGTWLGNVRLFEAEVPLFTTLRVGEGELIIEPLAQSVSKQVSGTYGLIGTDPSMKNVVELIDRVAPSVAPVSIFGESGTGKELVARAIHAQSNRSQAAFIPINCAAISKELIESELFGHEKGAFTGAMNARKGAFEEADGGTIFLDEIGELPLDLQAKLLRALESGEIKRVGAPRPITVDARVVAATNRDLLAMAREGKFREDLYYRLCVVPLHLPPLRARLGDLKLLTEHFVKQHAPRGQRVTVTPAAMAAIENHRWPGNVRELRNVIFRALLLRKGPNVDVGDLTFDAKPDVSRDSAQAEYECVPGMTLEAQLAKAERQIIESAIKRFGSRERTARELGIGRSTLFKRLKDWGLQAED